MNLRPAFAAAVAAIAGAMAQLPASAAVVTYAYSGVVDSDDASRGYSAFTGKFGFDTSAADQIADPQTADYKMGFWPLGVNVIFDSGAASASINDVMDMLVTNDLGGTDSLGALARTSDLLNTLDISLFDFSASVFSNDGLPGGKLKFSDFGWGTFSWEGVDGTLQGHLTGLSCIEGCNYVPPADGDGGGGCIPGPAPCTPHDLPEPAAPALSLTALVALFLNRRTQAKRKPAQSIQTPNQPERRANWSHAGFCFGALTVLTNPGA